MTTSSTKSVIPVFLIFMTMLLAWFTIGMFGFVKAVASKNWPTAAGTVISSQVLKPSGKSTKYTAKVTFKYLVEGKEYHSDKLKATAARGTAEWASWMVDRYPASTAVIVYYNSSRPKSALLEPGLQSDNYWMTMAPLLAFMLVLGGLIRQIKIRKGIIQPNDQ